MAVLVVLALAVVVAVLAVFSLSLFSAPPGRGRHRARPGSPR